MAEGRTGCLFNGTQKAGGNKALQDGIQLEDAAWIITVQQIYPGWADMGLNTAEQTKFNICHSDHLWGYLTTGE